jgi:predicted TIM-barrel fold metal-dependent hydrolase
MGRFGYTVIDGDGHGGDPPNWQQRLPKELEPQMQARRERIRQQFANLPKAGGVALGQLEDRPGMSDPAPRLEDMDLEGIDVTVMFPGGAGEEWAGLDRRFAIGLCRTLNDARAEYCRFNPRRLKSVAKLPLIDPEAAAGELRRAVTELGKVGMVTPQHIREKNLDHPSLDVVWAEAERLGVPVCVHGGGQAIDQVPIGVDRFRTRLEVHALTHPIGQMIAVDCFTVGGILHRFPKLRVAFLEAGVGWLPFWLERLDEHYELLADQAPQIDRKPSEYFLSGRCFLGADPEEKGLAYVCQALGDEFVVYASDYCHWDCKFPDTVKIIAERNDLSEHNKRRILGENAARLYGLA